jgi:flagellar assembly protein FliH
LQAEEHGLTIIKGSRKDQESSGAAPAGSRKTGGIIKHWEIPEAPEPPPDMSADESAEAAEEISESPKEEVEEAEDRKVVMIPTGEPKKEPTRPKAKEEPQVPPPPPTPPPPPVDKVIIEEAQRKADQIISDARAEAKKLLEESKLYCQSAFAQAEREGFEVGRLAGIEAGKEEIKGLIDSGRSLINQTLREREKLLRSCEPELAHMALKIAERIINTEVTQNPEAVIEVVRASLDKIKNREEVTVRVSPQDLEHARKNREVFEKLIEGLKSLDIVEDHKVERGGCIIETNLGNVDARIITQIAALEIAFKDVEAAYGPDD